MVTSTTMKAGSQAASRKRSGPRARTAAGRRALWAVIHVAALGCKSIAGLDEPRVHSPCQPGAQRCNGTMIERCDETGAWRADAPSATGSRCLLGECSPPHVVAGRHHTCARYEDGSVSCWGKNTTGQLGLGFTDPGVVNAPNDVCLLAGARLLAAGFEHSCAIVEGGRVQCWGDNTSEQLGRGCEVETFGSQPSQVCGMKNIVQISAMGLSLIATGSTSSHTCALSSDGGFSCWGGNQRGQLGIGSEPSSVGTPVPVPWNMATRGRPVQIAVGAGHTCVLVDTGEVYCWGDNSYGQLGAGVASSVDDPAVVSPLRVELDEVVQIAAGGGHTCAITRQGLVYCWGVNAKYQLGDYDPTATSSANKDPSLPFLVPGVTDAVEVRPSAGSHTCARTGDGSVFCWGENENAECGVDPSQARVGPTRVQGLGPASSIATGGNHSCAWVIGEGVKCWGQTKFGQLGNGEGSAESMSDPQKEPPPRATPVLVER
jgi:regulator of chromosome condensation (RCC1) repeat-containing protein/Regulator of Chromosome Condensation (RCC1) repeat protein